jgi:hypothetical protein
MSSCLYVLRFSPTNFSNFDSRWNITLHHVRQGPGVAFVCLATRLGWDWMEYLCAGRPAFICCIC